MICPFCDKEIRFHNSDYATVEGGSLAFHVHHSDGGFQIMESRDSSVWTCPCGEEFCDGERKGCVELWEHLKKVFSSKEEAAKHEVMILSEKAFWGKES